MSAIPLPTLMATAAAAILLLGAILLALGLRGRRINDHPVCRKCRFDLHGVYPASETCPECGRDLTRPRAIRTGERRRRRWAIALGALLLLASLGAIGAGGYATVQGANLNPYKPAWLLAMEAGNPTAAAGALAELTTRIQDDRLSDVRMESLVARALEHQADVNQTWIQEWGDLVETAWTHDHISRADYERYMRQTIDWEGALSLPLRERIEQGERLTVSLDVGRARAGATSALWLTAQLARVAVSGDVTEASGSRGMLSLGAQSTGRFSVSGPTIEAPPGKKPVEAEWRLIVGSRPPSLPAALGGSPPDADAAPEAPEVEWSVTLSGEIEVVPAGTPVVTEIDDPSIEQDLRAAVTFDRTSVRRQEDGLWPTGNVSLQERSLPVAFDIYWRAGGREWKVGTMSAPAGGGWASGYGGAGEKLPVDFDSSTVDIILRSNPAAAMSNPNITEIWKGELVFEDVAVNWPEPAEAPTPGGGG